MVEVSPLCSIHMSLTTASALHHSPHCSSRQASLCFVQLQDISSIAQVSFIKPHVLRLVISTPSDQVLSSSPKLSVLQDLLDLVLLMLIDCYWWGVGSHSIVFIGLLQAYMKDIVYASQSLPMPSTSEIQMVGSLPYPLGHREWSNEPVVQLPGAYSLRFLVLSST